MTSDRIVTVAVIGAGRMGRRHVQAARTLGLEIVGVVDTSEEALQTTVREEGVATDRLFTGFEALLRTTRPECVIVATTAPTHCEYTCMAAEAGVKHILCEKPMAVSLAECDRMIETCDRHGARLAVNHPMRFMERYTEPKRIIRSEAFGGLSSVTVSAGNFGLAMNGTHYFEMFRFMTEEPPAEVTAWFSPEVVPNPRGPQFEDRAGQVRLTTASGKRFYLEAGADQGHGMRTTYAGRYGQLTADELGGALHVAVREEEHRPLPTTRYGMPWTETAVRIGPADVVASSAAVLEALLEGADYPTGEDGRLAISTLVAAYLSHERGNVAVRTGAEDLPRERTFPWA